MDYRMVYELSHLDEKKILVNFLPKIQNQKNTKKINWFYNDNSYTIR